jgi:hypothetical protein
MNFEFYLLLKLTRSWEPEPKLWHYGSGSSQKFRLLAAPAPQHWMLHCNYFWYCGCMVMQQCDWTDNVACGDTSLRLFLILRLYGETTQWLFLILWLYGDVTLRLSWSYGCMVMLHSDYSWSFGCMVMQQCNSYQQCGVTLHCNYSWHCSCMVMLHCDYSWYCGCMVMLHCDFLDTMATRWWYIVTITDTVAVWWCNSAWLLLTLWLMVTLHNNYS